MDVLTRAALATTVGVVGAVLAALWLGFQDPYWAGLSALIIANVDRTALFTKGMLRIAGTAAGVIGGFYVAQALEGVQIAQFAALVGAAGFGTWMRQRSPYAYAWFYGALSFMLMVATTLMSPAELYLFAHYRCYEIVLGVVAATLSNWAIGPQAGLFPAGLARAKVTTSRHEAGRQAAAAMLGCGSIALLWTWFDLPALVQVLISSLVVIDRDLATTVERARQRLLGCVIGGAAALAVIALNAYDFFWWITSLAVGIYLSARVHLDKVSYAYVGTQSAVAILTTLVSTGPPEGIEPPLNRVVGILIGVAVMEVTMWMMAGSFRPARAAPSAPPAPQPGASPDASARKTPPAPTGTAPRS
ncbi:FUSC family protein [Segnochrobactraceae bacterium EtOH-i3]